MPKEEKLYQSRPKTLEEANAEIARLQAELASRGKGNIQKEPIAIIGMGCRYPGGSTHTRRILASLKFW